MHVNDVAVVRQVRAAFTDYEAALLRNDLAALRSAFWDDDQVVRFAFGDAQVGAQAIATARAARSYQTEARTMDHLTVNTFGDDFATVFAVFRINASGAVVQQSQTWVRFDGVWRVVAAQVASYPAARD